MEFWDFKSWEKLSYAAANMSREEKDDYKGDLEIGKATTANIGPEHTGLGVGQIFPFWLWGSRATSFQQNTLPLLRAMGAKPPPISRGIGSLPMAMWVGTLPQGPRSKIIETKGFFLVFKKQQTLPCLVWALIRTCHPFFTIFPLWNGNVCVPPLSPLYFRSA